MTDARAGRGAGSVPTSGSSQAELTVEQALERALALLGPLEGRIMLAVWTRTVPDVFVIRDVQAGMPELAYTTVMTTVNRLAQKGLLRAEHLPKKRAYRYTAEGTPTDFLERAMRQQVEQVVERFGEAALAAFAARLDDLSPTQRERLRKLAGR